MALRWIATGPDSWEREEHAVPPPGPGEVTLTVRAAGVNPADHKHVARATSFPVPVGYEVAGVVSAAGPECGFEVGDEVLAFRVRGGWTTELTVPAADVFAKPATLSFPQAANLLLAGCTAADLLHAAGARRDETVLLHGASGAVGVALLQLAAEAGVRVVGTASPSSFERVAAFDGVPVAYGPGLRERLEGYDVAAALDCAGTDEAVDVSLALVPDRARIVTVAAPQRARADGFRALAGSQPASQAYRDSVRAELVALAAAGRLTVPMAGTFALADAMSALDVLRSGHPGGKLALLPG